MDQALNILIVDDNPDDRALVRREVSREFPNSQFKQATNPRELSEMIEAGGLDAVARAHELAQGHPILVSRYLGPEDALVVLKPDPTSGDPLGSVGVQVVASPSEIAAAQPGDLLVLTPQDTPPSDSTLLFQEVTKGPTSLTGAVEQTVVVSVYRR